MVVNLVSVLKSATHKRFHQDTAWNEGTHWAAIWAKTPKLAYYFDSYGEKPNEPINRYLRVTFDRIIHNTHKFQSYFSSVCGLYTICFIYFMSLRFEFPAIIQMFKNSNNPDLLVRQIITSSFL